MGAITINFRVLSYARTFSCLKVVGKAAAETYKAANWPRRRNCNVTVMQGKQLGPSRSKLASNKDGGIYIIYSS